MSLLSELSIQLAKADAALEAQPQLEHQIAQLFEELENEQRKRKASEACVGKLIDCNQAQKDTIDGLMYAKTELEKQVIVLSEQVAAIERILHPQPVFMGQIALPPVQWVVKDPPTHAQDDNQATLALFCPGLVDKTVDEETLPQWLKDMAA
jgi:hypothetical protein